MIRNNNTIGNSNKGEQQEELAVIRMEQSGWIKTDGTEEPKPNPEPSKYDITNVHIFYKSDGNDKGR